MMPFRMIMTVANTVSRASSAVAAPPATMSDTMSATSMTVMAPARISVPYGSPTRCATTSAWWTAASTHSTRPTASTST